jgi:hypothetical protein
MDGEPFWGSDRIALLEQRQFFAQAAQFGLD